MSKTKTKTRETKTKVVLDVDTAGEVLALLEDEPGDADETLLDDARRSLDDAAPRVPSDEQRRVAAGRAVAFELGIEEVGAVQALIEENTEIRPDLLRRASSRLRSKLRRARRRRKRF